MAQTVHLQLQINGNDVEGESTVTSMGREGTIECTSFEYSLRTLREEATGQLTGKRQHAPVKITKRVDNTTPLLFQALCQNEPVTFANFRFFRPDTFGRGGEEHFYTVMIEDGYISRIRQLREDVILAGEDAPPMIEEVEFVFKDITWTHEIGGATHMDSWRDVE